jgi:hypothetical protein
MDEVSTGIVWKVGRFGGENFSLEPTWIIGNPL